MDGMENKKSITALNNCTSSSSFAAAFELLQCVHKSDDKDLSTAISRR